MALPSHIFTHYYAASHRVAWSVGLSVALSVCHSSDPAKMAETIKLPFGFSTRADPMTHVLLEVRVPTREAAILSGKQANHCKVLGHSAVICANTAEPIEVPFGLWAGMGPRHRVLHGVEIPHLKGQFWWIVPIVNHRHFLPLAVQKRLNRSICCLGCGLEWPKDAQIQSYSPGDANVPSWEDTLPSAVE